MSHVRLLLVCASLSLVTSALAADVGQPAPAFTLRDEMGASHALEQYRGKIVVLEWTNPECPFVQRHYAAKTMQKTLASFAGKKVVWLAVDSTSHNTPAKSKSWKAEQAFTYPVLQDASGDVGRAYGAKTTPHMFVIDEKGVLRYAGGIDDDPRGHSTTPTNFVEKSVNALLAGQPVSPSTSEPYGCSVKYGKSS
ncbi:MAG TPA: redoxin domain-containing protein [Myxococcaceae bacterium]|nr:redoxin domain-containing protein [Myxococcaceae bacterium]